MESRLVRVNSASQTSSPSFNCVEITGRSSRSPFELLIHLRSTIFALTRTASRRLRLRGYNSNEIHSPSSCSVNSGLTAWRAEVCAPVSILARIRVRSKSGNDTRSRQPMVVSPRRLRRLRRRPDIMPTPFGGDVSSRVSFRRVRSSSPQRPLPMPFPLPVSPEKS